MRLDRDRRDAEDRGREAGRDATGTEPPEHPPQQDGLHDGQQQHAAVRRGQHALRLPALQHAEEHAELQAAERRRGEPGRRAGERTRLGREPRAGEIEAGGARRHALRGGAERLHDDQRHDGRQQREHRRQHRGRTADGPRDREPRRGSVPRRLPAAPLRLHRAQPSLSTRRSRSDGRAQQRRGQHRSPAEPEGRPVGRGLDAAPLLLVAPEPEHLVLGAHELLAARAEQAHGPSAQVRGVEQRDGLLVDPPGEVGRLRHGPRARDRREVGEPDLERDRPRAPAALAQPHRDPVGLLEQLPLQRGDVADVGAERVLVPDALVGAARADVAGVATPGEVVQLAACGRTDPALEHVPRRLGEVPHGADPAALERLPRRRPDAPDRRRSAAGGGSRASARAGSRAARRASTGWRPASR